MSNSSAGLQNLVAKMTEGVTAEAYLGAKKDIDSSSYIPTSTPLYEKSIQDMPASPVVKISIDPRTSIDINSLVETAQMFLEIGNWERAISYFNQALEKDPNNALALKGLERAKRK